MASDASQSAQSKMNPMKPPRHHIEPLRSRKRRGVYDEIPARKIEQFMWTYPTAEVTALFFDVGFQPLYRWIKRNYGLTFEEFREKNMAHTRHALVQKVLSLALEKDNVRALAIALKNINGWSDAITVQPQHQASIQLKYSLDVSPAPRDVTPEPEDPERAA